MNAPFHPVETRVETVETPSAALRAEIDGFVRDHPDGTPFHRPAWMEAISAACGHATCYLIARERAGIAGLLPLHRVHSPLFGRALVSSGFAVGGGALAHSAPVKNALLNAAKSMAERLSFPHIELRGGDAAGAAGWAVDERTYAGFTAPLADDDDAQLLAIPRKQRAEVRKALKSDLTVETGRDARARRDHYAVYAASVRNLGTPVFPPALFGEVLDRFGDDADILIVRDAGEPVASVLSLYHRGTVMPYWGGGTFAARRLRANELMYYALMNHARRRGMTRFDFGRSKVGTGAFAYKKNWGFDPEPLRYHAWNANGAAARDTNPASAKYRLQVALWQRLPLRIANRLGPMISRGLA